jgi:glutathione peroxidase
MRRKTLGCVLLIAGMQLSIAQQHKQEKSQSSKANENQQPASAHESGDHPEKEGAEKSIYSFELPGPDGKGISLSAYRGKVLLLVNLGRKSSYNDQLPSLIKLSDKFKDQGLVVVGIPSNDFGAAEPGTDADIQKVYKTDDKVPFLVTARAVLTGDQKLPLYDYLTKNKDTAIGGDVHWNFTKFLIDRKGKIISRLDPEVTPDSAEMLSTLDDVFGTRSGDRPAGERPGRQPGNASEANKKI